jgi:AAA15 family ATPase/GTPase
MLVEFRVKNFRSFNEEQVLSLVAGGRDDSHQENLIICEGFNLVKAAAIHGANASGKSNFVKAMRFMTSFVRNSATKMNLGDKIQGVVPFRLDPDARRMPSSFELAMIIDGTRFEYGFSATGEQVHSEFLFAYPAGRRQRWLERDFGCGTKETGWAFRGPLKKEEKILKEKTRANGLVLSRGAELNIEALKKVFLWFREGVLVFDLSERPSDLFQRTAERIKNEKYFHDTVIDMIRHADVGIDDIIVSEEAIPLENMPDHIKEFWSRRLIHQASGEKSGDEQTFKRRTIQAIHRQHESGAKETFDFANDESNGTKRFFALCGPFLEALREGTVVVVDELECSMHPLLTRKLVELFQSAGTNKSGAQLIFATHDSTLMDPELFRRDQIWLVEKNQKGASELFSLHDFDTKGRPRNTEAFQRNYLAGRYGGVPKFGPIFEDLELK